MAGSRRLLTIVLLALPLAACSVSSDRPTSRTVPAPPPPSASTPPAQPVEKAATRRPQPPPPDPAEVLIAEAQKLYAAGLNDYQAGNTDQARAEFDRAVALMLTSKLDLKSDVRLKAAFDKLVEDIHSLEATALAPGDTPIEQQAEQALIESLADLTFPVDPNVHKRVEDKLKTTHSDLPLVSNEIVDGVVTYLQGRGSGFVSRGLQRMGQYRHVYEETLKREGLPKDLVYLAAAESAFNPLAVSRAGARGIWQLMQSRAAQYGLRKDRWVDERQDPVKSTDAAIRHLKELYQMFGDWYLVMAAYNCGPGTIQKAIEKTGYADFWTLHKLGALPAETKNHVPIILAIAIIAQDPQAYGLTVEPDPPVETDDVVLDAPIDLRLAAQLVDRTTDELVRINPALLRWTTPSDDPQFVLHLPKGTEPTFTAALAAFPPDKRVWWRAHSAEAGDTVASVARKYKVTAAALAKANNLDAGAALEAGSLLAVPLAPGTETRLVRGKDGGPRKAILYKIRSGDTLERIADRFDVTPYQIRNWNGLSSSRIYAGRSLKIYVPVGGGRSSRPNGSSRSRPAAAASPKPEKSKTSPSAQSTAPAAPPVYAAADKSHASQ